MNPSDSEPMETEHSTADDAPAPAAGVTQPVPDPAADGSLSPASAVHSEGAATSSSTTKDHTLDTSDAAASPSAPGAAPRSGSPTASPAADTAGGVSPRGGSGTGATSPANATDDASAASTAASSTTTEAAQRGSSQPPQLLAQAPSTASAAEQVAGSAPAGEQATRGPGQEANAPPTEPQSVQSGSPPQQAAQQGNPGGHDAKPLQLAAPTAPQADAAEVGAPQQRAPQSGGAAPPTGTGDGGSANNKTLKVEDALAYLEHVKKTFHNMPKVYSDFLDIMKAFKNKDIDTPGVIHRVSTLFCGHKDLILQFNTFLPAGYKIKEADLADRNHPAYVGPEQTYGTGPLPLRMGTQPALPSQQLHQQHQHQQHQQHQQHHQHHHHHQQQHQLQHQQHHQHQQHQQLQHQLQHQLQFQQQLQQAPPQHHQQHHQQQLLLQHQQHHLPQHPHQQHQHQPQHQPHQQYRQYPGQPDMGHVAQHVAQPGPPGMGTSSAPGSGGGQPARQAVDFNEAIKFVNKIKARFTQDAEVYKQFLEILQTYSQEQRSITEVYEHVAILFKDHPDLLTEFTHFLPDHGNQTGTQAAAARGQGANNRGRVKTKASSGPKRQPQKPPPKKEPVGEYMNPKEIAFFLSMKRQLGSLELYHETLKVLNLYTEEMVTRDELLALVKQVFGTKHECLFHSFKQFIDDIALPTESSPATMADQEAQTKRMEVVQMLPISQVPDDSCEQFGPSYRHLPSTFPLQRCSGRLDDLLCDGVLNDKWVACPLSVQASAGEMPFTLANRNKFEEKLIKSEDERFTLDLLIGSNSALVDELEIINNELARHPPEERLKLSLSDKCLSAVHKRCIERVYGPDFDEQILKLLHRNPAVAVPVVLDRLRKKQDEWTRLRLDCRKNWNDTATELNRKALDYRGFYFKQRDEAAVDEKSLLADISDRPVGSCLELKLPCSPTVQGRSLAAARFVMHEIFDEATSRDCAAVMQDLMRGMFGLCWVETELPPISADDEDGMQTEDGEEQEQEHEHEHEHEQAVVFAAATSAAEDSDSAPAPDSQSEAPLKDTGATASGQTHNEASWSHTVDTDKVGIMPPTNSTAVDALAGSDSRSDNDRANTQPASEGDLSVEATDEVAIDGHAGAEGPDNDGMRDSAVVKAADAVAGAEDDGGETDGMDTRESDDETHSDSDSVDGSAFDDDDLNNYDADYDIGETGETDDEDGATDDSGEDCGESAEDAEDTDDANHHILGEAVADDDGADDDESETAYQPREFMYEMARHACAKALQVPICIQERTGRTINSVAATDLAARVEIARNRYASSAADSGVKSETDTGADSSKVELNSTTEGSEHSSAVDAALADVEAKAASRCRKASSVFYGNEAFYLFFRMYQMLCDRMDRAFQLAQRATTRRRRRAALPPLDPHNKFLELLARLLASLSSSNPSNDKARLEFAEQLRLLLGPNAYTLCNFAEIIERTVQRLHALACAEAGNATVCQRLVELHALHTARTSSAKTTATEGLMDSIYRASVCDLLGPDVSCYKFEWSAPSSHQRYGALLIRLVEPGVPASSLCPEQEMRLATAYANKLATSADPAASPRRVFLKRNVRTCCLPSRSARLADVVQVNGLEMAVSVHYANPPAETDVAADAQRGFTSVVSASKRRRLSKPAGAPKRVIFVADTEDILYRRKHRK